MTTAMYRSCFSSLFDRLLRKNFDRPLHFLEHPDTERAITFTVAKPKEDADVSAALTKPEPKKAEKAKVEVDEDEGDEPEEPKKVAKKSDTTSGDTDPELDAIVDAWDD
jgi:hypothetical protein